MIPQPPWVLVSFNIFNILNNVFIIFITLGLALSHRSFARSLQKKRKVDNEEEALPSSWDDLETVPSKFHLSKSGEELLCFNQVVNNDGMRIFGFLSPSLLAIIKSATEWSIDGTFDITRWTLFAQVRFTLL